MPATTLVIRNKVGLHARPAALLVQTAKQFQSEIRLIKQERTADAKSILGVLSMGVQQNDEISISAEGPDSENALLRLRGLVEDCFGEPE
jgi:phosphocarrier protein